MDFHWMLIVINALSIIMSLIAIKKVEVNISSNERHYFIRKMEIDNMKKLLKKKEASYRESFFDALVTLPEDSFKLMYEPSDNTIVIRVKRDILINKEKSK